jgi:hypothetical protein
MTMDRNQAEAKTELTAITTRAVSETIENMTFVESVPSDRETPYDEHLVRFRVGILINAPFPGEIRLVLPVELASVFTANMHNLDENVVTDALMKDVLGELVNVIAGRVMAEVCPGNLVYHLGLPEVGPDVFLDTEASSLAMEFDAEGAPFWVILFGDGFQKVGD